MDILLIIIGVICLITGFLAGTGVSLLSTLSIADSNAADAVNNAPQKIFRFMFLPLSLNNSDILIYIIAFI